MAITRLKDLVTTFESKWTFGDTKFGYDGEVNEAHNTNYPLLLINPPLSIMPEIYSGREEYEFEINFYNLYPQAAQSAVTLQHRWDNLQDLAMEWFDMVLKTYQDTTVDAYLNDESLEIERVKEVANDKLVQIKFTFTMSAFTKCFRPQSFYPSDLSNLVYWFRADSGLTFDIPTKKISAWVDQSGKYDVGQNTKTKQPLRFGYDGANDKARIEFNGTSDYFVSDSDSIIGSEFTMFFVGAANLSVGYEGKYFSYADGDSVLEFGSKNGLFTGKFTDVDGIGGELSLVGSILSGYHIGMAKLHNKTLYLEYNNTLSDSLHNSGYDNSTTFDGSDFIIGYKESAAATNYFNGSMQEIIIYNSALTDSEISNVKEYLNTKYKIY
tara:strand:+ start:20 stop:1165 length:1146 start_codon:yes stop_codon:yes gene_type:complete